MVLLKVIALLGNEETGKGLSLKEAVYKKMVKMIMEDILLLAKANHSKSYFTNPLAHQTLNMLYKFWKVSRC